MRYHLFILFILEPIILFASDEWNLIRFKNLVAGQSYLVHSGTGFFVDNHYIITNNHVVKQCINISIRGSVAPSSARIIDVDDQADLALLYTETNNIENAHLRSNDDMNLNDKLWIIGYPLSHAMDGSIYITESKIIGNATDVTKFNQVRFIANIEHGNSGGPLLDSSGNVIGVVTGVIEYHNNPYNTIGIAIGLNILEKFLDKNSIYFHPLMSSDFVTNYNITDNAQKSIVNIHCITKN